MGAPCSAQKIKDQPYLAITIHMWKEKERKYALFDYSSMDSNIQNLQTPLDVRVCKFGENILAVPISLSVEGAQELFIIENQQLKPITEVWNIIRPSPVMGIQVPSKVQIKLGQHIRLGRVKIVLQEVCFTTAVATDESEQDEELKSNDDREIADSECACRFCMNKLGTLNNPLISPCICSGTVRYIHIKCLQQWISSKIKTRESNNIILYYWNQLQCEICKTNYKLDFKFQERRYTLLDIPKPKEAYISFSISHVDKNKEKGLYVINMNGRDQIRIGRVQDNDIKLQDISVSRSHAVISINKEDKTVFLEDQGSKFGTLVLSEEQPIVGRCVFQVANSVVLVDQQRKNYRQYELPNHYKTTAHIEAEMNQQEVLGIFMFKLILDDVLVNENNVNFNYLSGENLVDQ